MPRHRIEHEPRHRAPRQDRRVPLAAGSSRPTSHAKSSTGPGQRAKPAAAIGAGAADSPRSPSHAKPFTEPGQCGSAALAIDTRPFDSPRSPSHARPSTGPGQLGKAFEAIGSAGSERLHTAGTRIRNEQRVLLTGAARGLMVSPWFAAGAGFVIAAGAFMYAPHASLNFDSIPGRTVCPTLGCPVPQKVPQIAGGATGLVTASPTPSSSSPRGRHAAHDDSDSAPSFTYTVQPDGTGGYQMIITETSEGTIGNWGLSVVIPGATKVSVYDGVLQGSGTDDAPAAGPSASSAEPSPATSAGVLTESGYDPTNILQVVVDGTGSAKTAPEDYVFHDAQGTFSQH